MAAGPAAATGHHIPQMDYSSFPFPRANDHRGAHVERSKSRLAWGKSYFRKAGVEHDGLLTRPPMKIVFPEVELKP